MYTPGTPSGSLQHLSSQAEIARQDQIIYRFYLKTVQVLTDARLTHLGRGGAGAGGRGDGEDVGEDVKIDKWFSMPLPDYQLFRPELSPYATISSSFPSSSSHALPLVGSTDALSLSQFVDVPPLLIAFTLDISDVPAQRALVYEREDGMRFRVDVTKPNRERGQGQGRREREEVASGSGNANRREEEQIRIQGIVLERWLLRSTKPEINSNSNSSSHLTADRHVWPTSSAAYKAGVLHFKNVYDAIRTLPTYNLSRKLKRANNGLKIGIKLWPAEGHEDVFDLEPAWEIMEKGLVGLNLPLTTLSSPLHPSTDFRSRNSRSSEGERTQSLTFPPVSISNALFSLSVTSRTGIRFYLEDLDAVLSSALTAMDMHEKYFTPTMVAAGPRSQKDANVTEGPAGISATRPSTASEVANADANANANSNANPNPNSNPDQLNGTISAPVSSNEPSPNPSSMSSSIGKYGSLAEGLPFAVAGRPALHHAATSQGTSDSQRPSSLASRVSIHPSSSTAQLSLSPVQTTSSPIPTTTVGRRRSSLAMQAYPAEIPPSGTSGSPSGFGYRSSPLSTGFGPGTSAESIRPVSYTRPSSYLSQSGRSFTQMNNDSRPRLQSLLTSSASAQQMAAGASPSSGSYRAPSSLSPTASSSVQRAALGVRPSLATHASSPTPPILETHEEGSGHEGTPSMPQMIKRYSSSFGQRSRLISGSLGGTPGAHSSGASSGDPGSLMEGSTMASNYGSLRRTASRNSAEGMIARNAGGVGPSRIVSGSVGNAADSDDINQFLRTLESLTKPSSLTASALRHTPTSNITQLPQADTPSSLSGSSPRKGSSASISNTQSPGPDSNANSTTIRKHWTKDNIENALRKMADSFSLASPSFSPTSTSVPRPEGTPQQIGGSRRMSPLGSPRDPPNVAPCLANNSRDRAQSPPSGRGPATAPPASSPPEAKPTPVPVPAKVISRVAQSLPGSQAQAGRSPGSQDRRLVDDAKSESGDTMSRHASTERVGRNKPPVLLRGGFQQFAHASPARDFNAHAAAFSAGSSPIQRGGGGNPPFFRDWDKPRSHSQAPPSDDQISNGSTNSSSRRQYPTSDNLRDQESLKSWTRKEDNSDRDRSLRPFASEGRASARVQPIRSVSSTTAPSSWDARTADVQQVSPPDRRRDSSALPLYQQQHRWASQDGDDTDPGQQYSAQAYQRYRDVIPERSAYTRPGEDSELSPSQLPLPPSRPHSVNKHKSDVRPSMC